MTKRRLKVVDLSENATSKTLKIRLGDRDHQVTLQRTEIGGFGVRWLVSSRDLDYLFDHEPKAYYAALVSELANEKYVSSGVVLDLDELDSLVESGRSFKEGIPNT